MQTNSRSGQTATPVSHHRSGHSIVRYFPSPYLRAKASRGSLIVSKRLSVRPLGPNHLVFGVTDKYDIVISNLVIHGLTSFEDRDGQDLLYIRSANNE